VLIALIVFASMLVQDTAAAAKIDLLGTTHLGGSRPWLAGYCELANDWGAALSVGVGGATVLKDGASVQTALIFIALGAAAVFGTVAGDRLTSIWRRRSTLGADASDDGLVEARVRRRDGVSKQRGSGPTPHQP
jgi:hypothetical protein